MTEYAYWVVEIVLLGYALKSRRWALMVLAFSLPLSRRLPALPVPLLNYQNILFAVTLFSSVRDPAPAGSAGGALKHWPWIGALTVFFTASFMNTVLTFEPDFYPGLWDPYQNVMSFRALIMCLAIYVAVTLFIRSREDLLDVVRALVAGVIVEAGYACFEWLVLSPGRVTGHLAEPNSMGAYLAGSVPFLVALLILLPRPNPHWRALAFGLGVSVLGLLGTLSRGAWLSGLIGCAVVTLWADRRLLIIGGVALAFASVWAPESVKERFDDTLIKKEQEMWRFKDGRGDAESALLATVSEQIAARTGDPMDQQGEMRLDPSLQSRLVVWDAGAQMMLDYPLGVGFGVFAFKLHYYSSVVRWKAPHNTFLRTACETGIPALVCLLVLMGAFFFDGFRAARHTSDPEIRAVGVAMMGYVTALCVNSMGVDIMFQPNITGQFWCFAAATSQASTFAARTTAAPAAASPEATIGRPLYELLS